MQSHHLHPPSEQEGPLPLPLPLPCPHRASGEGDAPCVKEWTIRSARKSAQCCTSCTRERVGERETSNDAATLLLVLECLSCALCPCPSRSGRHSNSGSPSNGGGQPLARSCSQSTPRILRAIAVGALLGLLFLPHLRCRRLLFLPHRRCIRLRARLGLIWGLRVGLLRPLRCCCCVGCCCCMLRRRRLLRNSMSGSRGICCLPSAPPRPTPRRIF
jgi:hypothetical protein